MQAVTPQQGPFLFGQSGRVGRHDEYARRRPEETALYQCVAEHWPEFRERMEEQGGLPGFVQDEFTAYLGCGRLEGG